MEVRIVLRANLGAGYLPDLACAENKKASQNLI